MFGFEELLECRIDNGLPSGVKESMDAGRRAIGAAPPLLAADSRGGNDVDKRRRDGVGVDEKNGMEGGRRLGWGW